MYLTIYTKRSARPKQERCDLQVVIDAIDDIPIPAVRIFRDGHEVWCGAEHLEAVSKLWQGGLEIGSIQGI
jgi:hypothetical protein